MRTSFGLFSYAGIFIEGAVHSVRSIASVGVFGTD